MLKKLSEFSVGEVGFVRLVSGDGPIRRRILDMGITPSAQIYLRKKAPFGDPIEITVRNYELTLRKSEAELVTMEVK